MTVRELINRLVTLDLDAIVVRAGAEVKDVHMEWGVKDTFDYWRAILPDQKGARKTCVLA